MVFIKGQSGNPLGRPKIKRFRDYWTDNEIDKLVKHVKKHYKSKPELLKLIIEQIYGKAPQNINLGGQEDKPIPILFKLDTPKQLIEAQPQLEAPQSFLSPETVKDE